jgi:hypothetical protein
MDEGVLGYRNGLYNYYREIITDHFNRYTQAIPTRNQTARTTAEVLFNNYIVHYGIPERLHP